ncbi:Uncharacterized protein YigE, DUF2233 family [Devosia limi DSM 17137]|uniref:Uncharacterized protein YigE, DUF2233 family n=2 Tax=Devosia limi DSM 17137 TaxID=1121477 RepID=A0A1M5C448_9HYPH|nr:Uncharacterized protein YigE, DUF2233 family [Devosia limi DSM 17137]
MLTNSLDHSARGLAAVLVTMLLVPQPAAAADRLCAPDTFEGERYIVCTIDPQVDDLQLFWKNADGAPHRYFSSVAEAVSAGGRTLSLGVNAGMYLPDYSPSGLYIENGQELRPANTASVEGPPAKVPNFFKKPNGVFFIDANGAGVLPTEAFLEQRPAARLATQSGPMLVIDNQLHPAFIAGSSDRTRRSGVGVCENGLVRIAISESSVNFHDFARLFRDQLACPNALFLDGGRGVGIYSPDMGRNDRSWHGGFGPILGVVE